VNRTRLEALLREVSAGALTPEAALERLIHFPTEDLSFARLDHHRAIRQGQPEVVFAAGKTAEQVVTICERLQAAHGTFLCTRLSDRQADALLERFPEVDWNPLGRTAWLPADEREQLPGSELLVVTAGTSDLPVAEEAAAVAVAMAAQ
jgi:pyridinium-3,5-biscarboxylic acid mononucleotide synthase